jgi:sialate O-acetylesterase
MKKTTFLGSVLLSLTLLRPPAHADVRLPQFFGDGMVLQREKPVAFWGWADVGEAVTVQLLGKTYAAQPDASGRWRVTLDAQPAGGPHVISVRGKKALTVSDVLFGDVWVCGGQSNMEWHLRQLNGKYDDLIRSTPPNPQIRYVEIRHVTNNTPKDDAPVVKPWVSANAQTLPDFSAVGYFFAKTLYERYGVPIGLVACNWGGTIAEAWMDYESLAPFPHLQQRFVTLRDEARSAESQASRKAVTWEEALALADAGSPQDGPSWASVGLNTADWKPLAVPGAWEDNGLPGFDGLVWLRQEINLPKSAAGKELTFRSFGIDDADVTFFNGTEIGRTDGYNLPRAYRIPGNLVKAGKNVLAIRVVDTGGGGGLTGTPDSLRLMAGKQSFPLAGTWQYKIASPLKNFPPNDRIATGANPNVPTVLYNGMLRALTPYGIRGVIWYQGESNASRAYEYRSLFPAMIRNWRKNFGQGDVPFLFVQLANFMKPADQPGESAWAELREAQRMALAEPFTGMACTIDIGEEKDIHPKNKFDVGRRLALNAMHVAYGDNNAVYAGPMYRNLVRDGDKIRLGFEHVAAGLVAKNSPDGSLRGFTIAGEDKKWVPANARLDNNTVVVWSDAVKNPVAVRYAWADNPVGCNLYNAADLPASPFRTDDWQGITQK